MLTRLLAMFRGAVLEVRKGPLASFYRPRCTMARANRKTSARGRICGLYGGSMLEGDLRAWPHVRQGASSALSPAVPRQLYLPVGVNQFCRFTSLAWPRCWAALVR